MVHAVQIMKELAVHCSELDVAIRDAVKLRTMDGKEKLVLESYNRPIGSRLYQWIMGKDVEFWGSGLDRRSEDTTDFQSDETGEDNDQNNKQKELLKRMKRDRRANDELWISGVVISVIAALVISSSKKR